jgi:alanine dehydrogenase
VQLANKGWKQALQDNPVLLKGLNIANGRVTLSEVADLFGYQAASAEKLLSQGTTQTTLSD